MAKGMYVGAGTEFPIYEEREVEVEVPVNKSFTILMGEGNNLNNFFDITHGQYTFNLSSSGTWFEATNLGIDDTEAIIELTAKYDMSRFAFYIESNSEAGWDELSVLKNDYLVAYVPEYDYTDEETEEEIYIYDSYVDISLKAGDTVTIKYHKDGSNSVEDEWAGFGSVSGKYSGTEIKTEIQKVQVGTEIIDVAREVKKQYQSVDGVARNIKRAYAEVNGVARQYFGEAAVPKQAWDKYTTTVEYGDWEYVDISDDEDYRYELGSSYFVEDYEFHIESGLEGVDNNIQIWYDDENAEDAIGLYLIWEYGTPGTHYYFQQLYQVVDFIDFGNTKNFKLLALGQAQPTMNFYADSFIETVYADDGEKPEEGYVIDYPYYEKDWYLIEIDDEVYYYSKVDDSGDDDTGGSGDSTGWWRWYKYNCDYSVDDEFIETDNWGPDNLVGVAPQEIYEDWTFTEEAGVEGIGEVLAYQVDDVTGLYYISEDETDIGTIHEVYRLTGESEVQHGMTTYKVERVFRAVQSASFDRYGSMIEEYITGPMAYPTGSGGDFIVGSLEDGKEYCVLQESDGNYYYWIVNNKVSY